jgi:murein DD-endopeptidase MepM/ murein hydrolase activator NlpD
MKLSVLIASAVLLLVVVVGAGLWFVKFERQPPTAELVDAPASLGRNAAFDVAVRSLKSPGLRTVEVRLTAGGSPGAAAEPTVLLRKQYPGGVVGGVTEDLLRIEADLATLGVPEGTGQIEVLTETYGWRLFGEGPRMVVEHPVTIDITPPRVAVVSTQHNLRLGGSAVAVFEASGAERAEVVVGPYAFPATRGLFADAKAWAAVFAVPQDLDTKAAVAIRATDAVGNATSVDLPVAIRPRKFHERTLPISDAFLQRKIPEIYAANALAVPGDLVEGYLYVNRDMRQQSEKRLRGLTATSVPRPLWKGRFLRQPNASSLSAFADRRTYQYKGEIIDHQTHLGYDLASLRQADVVATQNGTVVFAENLGIYGNTIVLDHGLGVFSLYGHLSNFAVLKGQVVKAGEVVGQTGESGLAGGDHLHFSIMVNGIHVDPREWWDPAWIRDHVTAKLSLLPRAAANTPEPGEREPGEEAEPPTKKPLGCAADARPVGMAAHADVGG